MFGDKTRVKIKGSLSPPYIRARTARRFPFCAFPDARYTRARARVLIIIVSRSAPTSLRLAQRERSRRNTYCCTPYVCVHVR